MIRHYFNSRLVLKNRNRIWYLLKIFIIYSSKLIRIFWQMTIRVACQKARISFFSCFFLTWMDNYLILIKFAHVHFQWMEKQKLKLIRSFLQDKRYTDAHELCHEILQNDPDNYNALAFQGISLFNLGKTAESEKSYRDAIKIDSKLPLAYQVYIYNFNCTEY